MNSSSSCWSSSSCSCLSLMCFSFLFFFLGGLLVVAFRFVVCKEAVEEEEEVVVVEEAAVLVAGARREGKSFKVDEDVDDAAISDNFFGAVALALVMEAAVDTKSFLRTSFLGLKVGGGGDDFFSGTWLD